MLKYSDLRTSQRINLEENVPLEKPFTVFVEPTNVCNFRCKMCPESLEDYATQAGYYNRMPFWMFRNIVDDLKSLGKIKSLKFYFEGEPLLNPELPEMIKLAKDSGVSERIELTTNASLLTKLMSEKLVKSGLDYLRISIYALNDDDYQTTTQSRWKASQIIENIQNLRRIRDEMDSHTPVIYAQWLSKSKEEDLKFKEIFSEIADEVGIEPLHNWTGSDNRLVQIGGREGKYSKIVCPELFYTLAIKANGDVSCCCIDWSGKLIIGNVEETSLKEIWHGHKLRNLQRLHLEGRRNEIHGCKDCTLIYNFPDNLDNLKLSIFDQRSLEKTNA
jgi:radical SAM protein with 4Fe4S-binding SPASM domain